MSEKLTKEALLEYRKLLSVLRHDHAYEQDQYEKQMYAKRRSSEEGVKG